MRDSRVGTSQVAQSGKEIGVARVYDFALESGSYNTSNPSENQWDIALYDIQTYTEISLNEPITLTNPVHIKGRSSGATGYLRYDTSNSGILTAYNTKGKFSVGEKLIFDGFLYPSQFNFNEVNRYFIIINPNRLLEYLEIKFLQPSD